MRTAPTVRGRPFRRDATPCGSGGSRDHGASGTRRAWPVAAYSRLPPLPLRIAAGHALVLLLVLATLLSSPPARAVGLPPAAQLAGTPFARVGQGEMRWLGFKLYDAALWAGERGEAAVEAPHVLSIRYARAVSSERLVEVSLDEMRRLGFGDEARLARWGEVLAAALPSVAAGDTLAALHRPGTGATFWHQDRRSGEISDPELARAFFAIWLDPRTREPRLRAQLLGLADSVR